MATYQEEQLELRKMQIKYGSMYYTLPDTYAEKNKAYTEAFHAGEGFIVGYDVYIYRTHGLGGTIKIGNRVHIGSHSIIDYSGRLEIEDDVHIAAGVKIYSHKHNNFAILKNEDEGRAVPVNTVIKKGATLEAGSIIYPGVTIGEYATVYAGAVVMEDVEPYGIVAGNPARDIREIAAERIQRKKRNKSKADSD